MHDTAPSIFRLLLSLLGYPAGASAEERDLISMAVIHIPSKFKYCLVPASLRHRCNLTAVSNIC